MQDWYLWIKAAHVLAIVSWMAGLFYLPRLFVYHSDVAIGSEASTVFKTMERRLLSAIMRPAATVALITGVLLIWIASYSIVEPWLFIKLLAVAGMFAFHGKLEKFVKEFGQDIRSKNGRYFRIINEVPTVLLVIIVIFVIVKPFQ